MKVQLLRKVKIILKNYYSKCPILESIQWHLLTIHSWCLNNDLWDG